MSYGCLRTPERADNKALTADNRKVEFTPTNDEPMSEWIEIPRCRVLEVTRDELRTDFDCLDENGNECARGTLVYMIRRRRDNRVFKLARFQPLDGMHRNAFYLEEWS